jgi:hypothetical protein
MRFRVASRTPQNTQSHQFCHPAQLRRDDRVSVGRAASLGELPKEPAVQARESEVSSVGMSFRSDHADTRSPGQARRSVRVSSRKSRTVRLSCGPCVFRSPNCVGLRACSKKTDRGADWRANVSRRPSTGSGGTLLLFPPRSRVSHSRPLAGREWRGFRRRLASDTRRTPWPGDC